MQKSIFVKTAFPSSACLCLSGLARFDSCCLEASALASENRHMLVFQGWTAGALRPATPICQNRPTCTCKSVYVYVKKKNIYRSCYMHAGLLVQVARCCSFLPCSHQGVSGRSTQSYVATTQQQVVVSSR